MLKEYKKYNAVLRKNYDNNFNKGSNLKKMFIKHMDLDHKGEYPQSL